ncbi:MAG TPA: hypothetical protein VIW78_06445, partial [Burkholderiales bacterium]
MQGLDVALYLPLPGEILRHAVLHQAPPRPFVLVEIERPVDRPAHRLLVVVVEHDAGPGAS